MTPRLATIGYEGKTQAQMIAELKAAGVALVVDVRAVAASRRPGFSKTILAASLAEAGVGYEHLRGLGTPKAGRDAARAGRTDEMREIFSAHLAEPEAQVQLARAIELARERPIALLCYEAQACDCHRAVVAERICEALETTVADL
ncbi:MAG: DUF488 domain-containing protein [Pseudomonadota bacterium]